MDYKVIALSVGGRGNKIFSSGDIVSEEKFPVGTIDSLVKGGYIEPIGEKKDIVVSEIANTELITKGNAEISITIDSKTKKELIKELKEKGIEFSESESKKDLFEKYLLSL
jgi:hypothetical protein